MLGPVAPDSQGLSSFASSGGTIRRRHPDGAHDAQHTIACGLQAASDPVMICSLLLELTSGCRQVAAVSWD